jgi:hypothetical protein
MSSYQTSLILLLQCRVALFSRMISEEDKLPLKQQWAMLSTFVFRERRRMTGKPANTPGA